MSRSGLQSVVLQRLKKAKWSVQSFEQALVGRGGDSAFEIDADGLLKVGGASGL